MPPPSASVQRHAINQVVSITGVSDSQATKLLRQTKYNIEQAINIFFNGTDPRAETKTSLKTMFDGYHDPSTDEDDKFGLEGAMKYLGDLNVKLDEITCLGIAEICKCPAMGEFTRDGFVDGWLQYDCPTLQKQQAHAKQLRKAIANDPTTFRRVYRYGFLLSRMPGQRNVLFDIAVEQWGMFFNAETGGIPANTNTTPWLDWWIEFLEGRGKKPINKDLWEQFEVFLRKAQDDESFGWYDADGAWPGAIDDFVSWVQAKRDGNNMEVE